MKRALVLSLICVLGLAFSGLAATLSGSWDTDVTIDPTEAIFSEAIGLTSLLTVNYMVSDWTFTSVTKMTENGWRDQDFSVTGVLGAFSLTSALGFIPFYTTAPTAPYYVAYDAPEFTNWTTTAAVSIAGVSFSAKFSLVNPGDFAFLLYPIIGGVQTDSTIAGTAYTNTFDRGNNLGLTLKASGVAGDVTFSGSATFGAANSYIYAVSTDSVWAYDPDGVSATVGQWVNLTPAVSPAITHVMVVGNTVKYGKLIGGVFVEYDNTTTEYSLFRLDDAAVLTATAADSECDLDWTGISISIGFPFCCADITSKIAFDCDGFDYVSFTATGIVIPNLPWVTLDATVKFTIDEKDLTLSPKFDFGVIACFDLWFSVDDAKGAVDKGWTFDSISIDGISLTCDIGGVSFTGASYWGALSGEDHPFYFSSTNDKSSYWEYYKIATNDDGCCGPFNFDLGIYFLDTGVNLFEVGLIEANMSLQIASQFTFNMGLDINVNTGTFAEWTVGFLVTW